MTLEYNWVYTTPDKDFPNVPTIIKCCRIIDQLREQTGEPFIETDGEWVPVYNRNGDRDML